MMTDFEVIGQVEDFSKDFCIKDGKKVVAIKIFDIPRLFVDLNNRVKELPNEGDIVRIAVNEKTCLIKSSRHYIVELLKNSSEEVLQDIADGTGLEGECFIFGRI